MTWRNDGHGLLFRSPELKLFGPLHTWAMKLSQLPLSYLLTTARLAVIA